MSAPYTVLILDAEGCELSNTEYNTRREAIQMAREKIGPASGNEYQDWRTIEIRDAFGECVWDKRRYPHCRVCGEAITDGGDCCGTDEFPEPSDLREWA